MSSEAISASVFLREYSRELHNKNAAVFAGAGLSMETGYVDWTSRRTGSLQAHGRGGKQPYSPDSILKRCIRPAATRAKITKHIGWHTFRRTFSTLLKANGEDIKVV